jgi:hypothetical protein
MDMDMDMDMDSMSGFISSKAIELGAESHVLIYQPFRA